MADINIERKTPSAWGLVLWLAAIIAVVSLWAAAIDEPEPESAAVTDRRAPAGTAGTAAGAVEEYLGFAGMTGAAAERPAMGREHDYTAEGIRKLGAALQTLSDRERDADTREKFTRFRQTADRLRQDPSSLQHANQVRDVFTQAADVIESLDEAAPAGVRAAAEAIDPNAPLLDQRDKVRHFFRESARAIQAAKRI